MVDVGGVLVFFTMPSIFLLQVQLPIVGVLDQFLCDVVLQLADLRGR